MALITFVYKSFYHSPNTLKHTLVFLKCMVSEHVFMNLASFIKKNQPSLVYRLGKIGHALGISTTCTNRDIRCSLGHIKIPHMVNIWFSCVSLKISLSILKLGNNIRLLDSHSQKFSFDTSSTTRRNTRRT